MTTDSRELIRETKLPDEYEFADEQLKIDDLDPDIFSIQILEHEPIGARESKVQWIGTVDLGFGDRRVIKGWFDAESLPFINLFPGVQFLSYFFFDVGEIAELRPLRSSSLDRAAFRKTYNAKLLGVYDGDTITTEVDRGFSLFSTQKIRLLGLDTPEVRGVERADGIRVRDRLMVHLGVDPQLKIQADRRGKFGRWLGVVFVKREDGWENINQWLLDEGLARPCST